MDHPDPRGGIAVAPPAARARPDDPHRALAREALWSCAGWLENPLLRSATGWDGEPVAWIGSSSHDDVRAVLGAASHRVGGFAVEQRGHAWTVPIESPCGAFIVGLEEPAPATLRVLDGDGRLLPGADGVTKLTV